MNSPVSLLGLATAVPPYVIDQDVIARLAPIVFQKIFDEHPGMADIFAHTGIERRNFVRPLEWFGAPRDWSDRAEAYVEGASDLFVDAAQAALARAGLAGSDVDIVVTVSSTGIATPSIDARVGTRMGWRRDIMRVPVFGLGCAGGVSGLGIASRLARAEPGKNRADGRGRAVLAGVPLRSGQQDRIDRGRAVRRWRSGRGAARR